MQERYVIRIHGLLGPLLRSTFGSLTCEAIPSQSMIRGRLSTEELLWLLGLLEKSGVELVRLESAP